MPLVISPLVDSAGPFQGTDSTQKIERVYFKIVPSGNYPALGDPLDFTTLGDLVKSSRPPLLVVIQSAKSGGASGFIYEYSPGAAASQANGKMQVFTGAAAQSALTELNAGAYPAGVTGDVIIGYADFQRY